MENNLTVFMPVYNGEKYIKNAIQSILEQSYKDFQFLIINDGSTDESVNIIKSFNDSRINLVHNSKNEGLVYTRNKGFELVNTKFIAFNDCDDISYLTRIEEEFNFLNNNPDYGICGSSVKVFGDFEEGFWGYPEHHEDIKTLSLFKCQISNSTAMINANLFKNYDLKYMEGFFLAEDYELWVRALENIKAYNIQKPLVGICVHDESICHKKHNILKSRTYDVYKKLLYKLGINPTEEELNLHSALGEYAVLISINNYLERTEKWLFKLIEANKIHKIYNSKNFNSMIDKLWFEACNQYINDLKYDTSHKRKIFYRSISKYFKSILKK